MYNRSAGFTLVGALVSVALVSMLGLYITHVGQIAAKVSQSTDVKMTRARLDGYFIEVFRDPANCRVGLRGKSAASPISNVIDPFQPSQNFLSVREPIREFPQLKTSSIEIKDRIIDITARAVPGVRFWKGEFVLVLEPAQVPYLLGGNGSLVLRFPIRYSTNLTDENVLDCSMTGGGGTNASALEQSCLLLGGTLDLNNVCRVSSGLDIRDFLRIEVEAGRFRMIRPPASEWVTVSDYDWRTYGTCPGNYTAIGIRQYWANNDTASLICALPFRTKEPGVGLTLNSTLSYLINHSTLGFARCDDVNSGWENEPAMCPAGKVVVGIQYFNEHPQPPPVRRGAVVRCCERVASVYQGLYPNERIASEVVNINTVDVSYHRVHENETFVCPEDKVLVGVMSSYENSTSKGRVACGRVSVSSKL